MLRPNPGVGANLSATVPGHELWVVEAVSFRLVTDATVATRVVTVNVDDGTTPYLFTSTNVAHTASLTFDYSAFMGAGVGGGGGGVVVMPWPDGGLPTSPGSRIRTVVESLQAGDQISRVRLLVLAYPTGPRVNPIPRAVTLIEPLDGLDTGIPSYLTP